MPKSLLKKNKDELIRFTDFEDKDIAIVDGTPKQRDKLMQSDAKVFLFGFKMFSKSWEQLRTYHPDVNVVAVDEWHMGFGGNSSAQTESLYACMRKVKYFTAMTGTMVNGKLTTVYPFIHILEPRYYGTEAAFKNYHGVQDMEGNIVAWQNHEKISRIFAHHCIRRTFTEVYGAEAKVVTVERVQMGEKQRAMYDEFEKNAILELEDSFLDGNLPGVHVIRCRQIMGHPDHIPNPARPGEFVRLTDDVTGKDERFIIHLVDHINAGTPLVTFASMVPEVERIAGIVEQAGRRVGMIHGGVSIKERNRIDEAFRAGELDDIVGSPGTAAMGYNWQYWGTSGQEVGHVIFASMDYRDTSYLQAYRRMMRDVRKSPLWISILEYEKSIDQRIFEIVRRKSEDANKVDPSREILDFQAKKPIPADFRGSPLDL